MFANHWSWLALAGLFFSAHLALAATPTTQPATPRTARIRIVLAGDSTVTAEKGWGEAFTLLLKDDVECINRSASGRSSKSYRDEGHWKPCLADKPDYIFIQFGHNDQPGKGADRETAPNTTYRANMERYVDEARAVGAQPILVTSMSRREFGKDEKIHSTLTPYVDVVKEIAAEKHVPLIDLHARTIELYNQFGKQKCIDLIAPKPAPGEKLDNTHLSPSGGKIVAALVAEEVRKNVPGLAAELKVTPEEDAATTQP